MTINLANKNIESREILVCFTACIVVVSPSIISLFNGFIRSFIILPYKLDTLSVYGAILLLILVSIKTIIVRSSPLIYGVIAFFLFGYLIAFLVNSYYYEYYFEYGIDFLFRSAPWLLVTYAVRDNKLLKKCLYFSALIIMVSFTMNLYVFNNDFFAGQSYTQSHTYTLLPVAIIIGGSLFDKIRWFNVVVFLVSIILMFSMGARGPIVCVVMYLVLKSIIMYKFKPKRALLISAIILTGIIPVYVYFYKILANMLTIFQKMNLSTRTILRLMEGSFFEDSARGLLAKHSIDLIKKYPISGVGVGNERILLINKMGSNGTLSEAMGWYPHNIFLEILLHFGIFIGGAIVFFIIKILCTTIFKNINKDGTDIVCIFVGIGLFPLLFTGSYITSPLFFALLGVCLSQYKKLRRPYAKRYMDKKFAC